MTNWDDRRFFLAVAREVSIRKAANTLGVSRSTVLRRIAALEDELGVRLFERLPNGYFTTSAGEEMLRSARRIEEEATATDRRLAGRDTRLSGKIRVTLPGVLATHLLMPDIVAFGHAHPDIKLEVTTAYSMANLAKRQADVAIRMSNDPPEDLVGRRVVKVAKAGYVCKDHLPATGGKADLSKLSWIGWSNDPSSLQWVEDSDYPHVAVGAVVSDPTAALEAVRAGMGMAILPCFMADVAADLYRMPPGNPLLPQDLWILTHQDLRNTARIRKFTGFMAEALLRHRDLVEGRRPREF